MIARAPKRELRALLDLPELRGREELLGPFAPERTPQIIDTLRLTPDPPRFYPIFVSEDVAAGTSWATPLRLYRPAPRVDGESLPIVIYFHGGGWVYGNLETHDALCRAIANNAGALVVSIDYRLAPEHVFPEPVEESVIAVQWFIEHATELGGDPARVVVAGSSSGGNLAAAVVLEAHLRGASPFMGQVLLYPALDGTCSLDAHRENASGYVLSAAEMAFYWRTYAAGADPLEHPLLSPMHAEDLAGLPPTLVVTAEFDVLRDDGIEFHRRLVDAGVDSQHLHYDGQIHGFLSHTALSSDPGHCQTEVGAWLRRRFATPSDSSFA